MNKDKFKQNTIKFIVCDFRNKDEWLGTNSEDVVFNGEVIVRGYTGLELTHIDDYPKFLVLAHEGLDCDWYSDKQMFETWVHSQVDKWEWARDWFGNIFDRDDLYRSTIAEIERIEEDPKHYLNGKKYAFIERTFEQLKVEQRGND